MNPNTPTRSTVNADTTEAFAERERRKRVIDLARAIYCRHPHLTSVEYIQLAEAFDRVAEKYRKDGAL